MPQKLIKSLFTLCVIGITAGALVGCKSEAQSTRSAQQKPELPLPPKVADGEVRKVEIKVTEKGYEPSPIALRKGEPVELSITRTTDMTCATELILEDAGIDVKLPLNETVTASFTPDKTGVLKYGCAMGKMIAGTFEVRD
ncbi:MAG TPA: cupredoxin domain-containing protein [Myxococcaceae bacterium]|nr:cupredoxin domain-containing protein [Myxococcaceae bacterium]